MKTHHQVLIIGGGPAGAAAAHTLARRGIDVAVVDKTAFPRDKLCGGLLTLRSRKIYQHIFESSWDDVVCHTAHGVKFMHQGRVLSEVVDHRALCFTRRLDFDQHLLDQAIARGARMYLGDAVVAIDMVAKRCRLGSGCEIGYDTLIGADGVNSLVAKTLFGRAFNQRTVAFALEMEVDRARHATELTDPEIHFGVVNWGYAWVFPKRDTVTVGVGGLHARNPGLKTTFSTFLRDRFRDLPEGRIKGHHLPFGDYRRVPGRGDVLLCGDAAGLVDPITGEGIAFAMQSGHFAAEAIIESGRRPALPAYRARYREITRDFDHANRLRHLLFPTPCERLFLRALPSSESLALKHLELMADEVSYGDYARHMFARGMRRLGNTLLFRSGAGHGQ